MTDEILNCERGGFLYVADIEDIARVRCFDKDGNILWESEVLGIDGIVFSEFTEDEIHGSGCWDPPDGWRRFVLDLKTGTLWRWLDPIPRQ